MSFIIKNLDNSRPNLQLGEFLDSELVTTINMCKNIWDQKVFPGSTYARFVISKYRGEMYYVRIEFTTEDKMLFDGYNRPGTPVYESAVFMRTLYNTVMEELHRLAAPNLFFLFDNIATAALVDNFEANLRLSTTYSGTGMLPYDASLTNRSGGGTYMAPYMPQQSGGLFTTQRDEMLRFGTEFCVGFKYFGDAERTIESVKNNSTYISFIVQPEVFTNNKGERLAASYSLSIYFYEIYRLSTGNLNIFKDITPENVIHKNDLPDDENTYPGGGEDKNEYPLDDSGRGTFDNSNDPVDFPDMPLWDATSTGFISMWNPTITEIYDLYSFLWDSDISTTLKKLFLEPMEAIISLAFFPVDPITDGKRNVTIGHVDTEIQMNHVQKQFVDFDFGTIKLDEYYGAAWDYSPYTKVSIYLPYIGSQELDVDDVMNSTLHLKYRIDLLSGMCVAMLKATRARDDLNAVVYTWQGNCAMQVPVTSGSAREFLNSIIQLGAMTGLALVQPAAGSIAAAIHKPDGEKSNTIGNNWINPTIAGFSALNVLGQKVHVQRGGRVDANAGVASIQKAYIIINRPVSAIPKGWNQYAGYPSLKIKTLSTQKGYTEVAFIKLNSLEATADEISELNNMLRGGVIL